MESAGLVLDALGRVRQMVREAISDLSAENARPPKTHIAWPTWHIARVQDANFSGLLDAIAVVDHRSLALALRYGARIREITAPAIGNPASKSSVYCHGQNIVARLSRRRLRANQKLLIDCYQCRFEPSPQRTAILSIAHPQRPSCQRHQLQHASCRSDRVSARPGQVWRLVPWGGKTKRFRDIKLYQCARVDVEDHRRSSTTICETGLPLMTTEREPPLGFAAFPGPDSFPAEFSGECWRATKGIK